MEVEGNNNYINTIKRQAYRFHDDEYFKPRILYMHDNIYIKFMMNQKKVVVMSGKNCNFAILIVLFYSYETMGRFPIFDTEAVLYSNSLMKIGIFCGTAAVSVV